MNCREVERLLSETIERAEEDAVQQHLQQCEPCRKLHRDLKHLEELSSLLREAPNAPQDFTLRVRRLMARPSWSGVSWSPIMALCAVLVVTAVLLWPTGGYELQTERELLTATQAGDGESGISSVILGQAEGSDSHVDVILEDSDRSQYILRVPSRIEIRTTELHDEFYIHNVSH